MKNLMIVLTTFLLANMALAEVRIGNYDPKNPDVNGPTYKVDQIRFKTKAFSSFLSFYELEKSSNRNGLNLPPFNPRSIFRGSVDIGDQEMAKMLKHHLKHSGEDITILLPGPKAPTSTSVNYLDEVVFIKHISPELNIRYSFEEFMHHIELFSKRQSNILQDSRTKTAKKTLVPTMSSERIASIAD